MRGAGNVIFAGIVAAVAAALVACGRREASAAAPAPGGSPRIVALSPALAVTLRDLGLESAIVGRHAWDMALDKSVPICGDQSGLDYEAILRAKPTHVLLEWGSRDVPARLNTLAAEHRWTLSNHRLLTLPEVEVAVRALATEFAPPGSAQAERATGVLRDMQRAWSRRGEGFAAAGTILLLESSNPPAALGPFSFHHEILVRIGGTPAITEGAAYLELHMEDVMRLAPDGIVLIFPRAPGAPEGSRAWEDVAPLLGPLDTRDIPAIRERRVALIDDPLALTPSTAMIGFADELAGVLIEWARDNEPGTK